MIGIISSCHFEFREFRYIKMNKLKILVTVYFQIMILLKCLGNAYSIKRAEGTALTIALISIRILFFLRKRENE